MTGSLPSWRDPRVAFALILTTYCVLGVTVLGFNRSSTQMLTVIAAGCALDTLLGRNPPPPRDL